MRRRIRRVTAPARQRCCLLAEDAGAERTFPQGSFGAFLSGIFSLTVRLYCASISRSRWSLLRGQAPFARHQLMGIELPVLPLLPPGWEKASPVSRIEDGRGLDKLSQHGVTRVKARAAVCRFSALRASGPLGPDYVGSDLSGAPSCRRHPTPPAGPNCRYAAWKDTCETLHLWTQVIGKVRLALTPWLNHSWHVTLHVTARGLGTPPIAHEWPRSHHRVRFHRPRAVAAHQRRPFPPAHAEADDGRGILRRRDGGAARARHRRAHQRDAERDCRRGAVSRRPRARRPTTATIAERFWRVLLRSHRGVLAFPHGLSRQGEPGAFLLGQLRPCGDALFRHGRRRRIRAGCRTCRTRWRARPIRTRCRARASGPGGGAIDYPAFYSYAYPAPEGFAAAQVRPDAAFWSKELGEFILPYDAVRTAREPEAALMAFLQSTYDAAADLGRWDRHALECELGDRRKVRPV